MFQGNQQLLGEISGFPKIAKAKPAGVKKGYNPVCWLMSREKPLQCADSPHKAVKKKISLRNSCLQ